MAEVIEILSHGRQGAVYITYSCNIMAADDLETQGARASGAMVLTLLSRNIPVVARELKLKTKCLDSQLNTIL